MSVQEKADRLLLAEAVTVLNAVEATVKGDHDTYAVYREPDRWRCTCPSRLLRCSHIDAVERVT